MRASLLLSALAAAMPAQNIGFIEHLLPPSTGLSQITAGPDGALWFTGNKIGRITTAGANSEYEYPTVTQSFGITTGSDGALWFTEQAGNIGRITTAGIVTEFPVPTPGSGPFGIAPGPDGALWFTESFVNAIGRVTTAGVFTSYPIPTANAFPQWITAGPDGALWFAELTANKIGRITTAGTFSEFPVPAGTSPQSITSGPDGALWFTGQNGTIGRITTTGALTEYTISSRSQLNQITAGPDGALWFVDAADSSIGRITTSGVGTEFATPTRNYDIYGITKGPDGALWFTEGSYYSKIGQAVFQTAALSTTPDTGTPGTQLTFSGTGFAPNETVNLYTNSTSSNLLATAFADGAGSFVLSGQAHQAPNGPSSTTGVGQTSGKIGVAPFATKARLLVSPTTASVGTTVTVDGVGFQPDYSVSVYSGLGSGRVLLGVGVLNAVGTFSGDGAVVFKIPAGTPPGPFDVTANVSRGVAVGAVITIE